MEAVRPLRHPTRQAGKAEIRMWDLHTKQPRAGAQEPKQYTESQAQLDYSHALGYELC